MRLLSSDKTVLVLIGFVLLIAGLFTYSQRNPVPATQAEQEKDSVSVPREPLTPEQQLRQLINSSVGEKTIRSVQVANDAEHDSASITIALHDKTEGGFAQHAPSTKLYYDFYKQKEIPIHLVTITLYRDFKNDYGSMVQERVFETQLSAETVKNTINLSTAEKSVRETIGQKWTVIYDKTVVDAKDAERHAKRTPRSRFGMIKPGMTEEAVERIMAAKGECSKDSTKAREAKVCTYYTEARIHYLNARVTDKDFVRAK